MEPKTSGILWSIACGVAQVAVLQLLGVKGQLLAGIYKSLITSVVAFIVVLGLIPTSARYLERKNLFGYDKNKAGKIKVPEAVGVVSGMAFVLAAIISKSFCFAPAGDYNAAVLSILLLTVLGFADDVLDISRSIKLTISVIGALPLLRVATVPIMFCDFGQAVGKVALLLLTVFCSNSINIHAGINGLEVGQSLVIAAGVWVHNVIQLVNRSSAFQQGHLISIFMMQPFLAVSLALFAFNWFPSSVFVGDSYTYFAGMALAAVGIIGHFSWTLFFFFAPQFINFACSIYQLYRDGRTWPKHRLPRFDPNTGLLNDSDNLTLVNLFLKWFGPTTEASLCKRLLAFQAMFCCIYLFVEIKTMM